ncbi:MAG: hypothetical protein KC549_01640, partial [Myxococcales bacterium]|nr:hypothetical protein [Myxococcales bacterium]
MADAGKLAGKAKEGAAAAGAQAKGLVDVVAQGGSVGASLEAMGQRKADSKITQVVPSALRKRIEKMRSLRMRLEGGSETAKTLGKQKVESLAGQRMSGAQKRALSLARMAAPSILVTLGIGAVASKAQGATKDVGAAAEGAAAQAKGAA